MMTQRERFVWVAEQYLGRWYKWGGDDPEGFDCSGLVIEAGMSVGLFPRNYDATASGILTGFLGRGFRPISFPRRGDIVFWGRMNDPETVTHVEIVVDDGPPILSLGASGGGSKTLTVADAIHDTAFVKVRPVESRDGFRFAIDPFRGKM